MKEDEFLGRIQEVGGLPTRQEADRWALTVLVALIHLLPNRHERLRFMTQLPGTLKARLRDEPPGALLMDRDTFVQHVAAGLGTHAAGGERALRVVDSVLGEAVAPGEMAKVRGHLPKDLAGFLERSA